MYRAVMSIVLCALMFAAIFIVEVPKDVSAQVTEEWIARYNGPGNDYDQARDIAVDPSGNVYVTGYSEGSGTGKDYTTVAYDSSGNELWVARYNGTGNGDDMAVSIALGTSGNVYVTGYSEGSGTGWDYATVVYDSFGNEVWVARYNGPSNHNDIAQDIAVDSSENVLVTGRSEGNGTDYDYATIKYDLYGNEQWVKRYNGPVNESDMANAIALDPIGNIYVTGNSPGNGTSNDYATIKYDSSGGELWVARYNGPANGSDWAWAMALDSSGNVYVTGQSEGSGTNNDYVTIAYDPSGNELWVARYDGPESSYDEAYAIALDSSGNIYVTGASWGCGTYYDFATVAYDSSGNELWVARYNGPGNGPDTAEAIALDSSGNIYVTGFCDAGGVIADYATTAYNSSGNELWVARYNGPPGNKDDCAKDIAVDSSGNIYVTGFSYGNGTGLDYCTIKYSQVFPNQPPTADAGPDQTIYLGEEVQLNGSASYDPDGTIVTYEWDFNASDGLWWDTGAPPDAFGANPTNTYNESGVFVATLRVTDNNGSMDTDTCEISVLVLPPLPPILYINISVDGKDVILYWDPLSNPGIDHYLLYRSTSQTGFDFNTVWVNTSKDNETGEPGPIPLRTMWNDTNAAFPDNETNYEEQYYYIIRAVNKLGEVSDTSRTVGKWTRVFPQGVSTFSLPLEPIDILYTDNYTSGMNAEYIKYMNTTTHTWMQHNFGDGGTNNTKMKLGEGYEVKLSSEINYTFIGMPGAMIRYGDDAGFSGFDPNTEAKNLTAAVDPVTGNVTLSWSMLSSKNANDQYHVLRSLERDGFWNGNYVQLATLAFDELTYTDIGNATAGTRYYYMIVPVNETGMEGASTYSVGVWTANFSEQYDTIGMPLKIVNNETVDWYCDNIPDTVGINYYNVGAQRWSWHSTRMPEGAFDPILVMTEGYQISTSNTAKFTFAGV